METVSTGHGGLDRIIDGLRLGDNVVWRVDSLADFAAVTAPFVAQARSDGRRVVHIRFGDREPWPDVESRLIDPAMGFERFAMAVHDALTQIGPLGFYVFDPLADLHRHWHTDLMVMNFFKATCPYLFSTPSPTSRCCGTGTPRPPWRASARPRSCCWTCTTSTTSCTCTR